MDNLNDAENYMSKNVALEKHVSETMQLAITLGVGIDLAILTVGKEEAKQLVLNQVSIYKKSVVSKFGLSEAEQTPLNVLLTSETNALLKAKGLL